MGSKLDTVQYIVLHPLFSLKALLIKLFKNFEEKVKDFFNVTDDSLAKKKQKNLVFHLKCQKAIKLNYFIVLKT